MSTDRSILVVGGGITGLAAAMRCVDTVPGAQVTVIEASDRWGGKIATSPFAGLDHVDEGPDAFLARAPAGVRFAARVGLSTADLTSPEPVSAAIWHRRLHRLPGGVLLGIPAELRPFATTDLLSWRGKLRAAIEPLLPATVGHGDSLGALVRARFGHEVHERLVDALVGSIYATDTDRSSLTATPQLAAVAASSRSLLLGARRARRRAAATPSNGPLFYAPTGGMGALVDHAVATLTELGATLHLNHPLERLERDGAGWRANDDRYDAVVLCLPRHRAAPLLANQLPDAARAMHGAETAHVTMVRLAVPQHLWPERLHGKSGYLVPKPVQRHVTAASFGSQKWAHWRSDDYQILRVSLGRDGRDVSNLNDDVIIDRTIDDVGLHLDFDMHSEHTSVTRWADAFPQYRPGHIERVAVIEAALPDNVAVAGASYHGIGIPACISSAEQAIDKIAISTGTPPTMLAQ